MKSRAFAVIAMMALVVSLKSSWAMYVAQSSGESLTTSAIKFLKTLDKKQLATAQQAYDSKERVGWHFIPKDKRKGLQIKHMSEEQRVVARQLLKASLGSSGYKKATQIMALEGALHQLEGGKGRNIRDTERYYYTIFGEPSESGRWGLSIEGHHLSLNFVVDKNEVISSTPCFFAANPGDVKADVPNTKIKKGTRVLAREETLAFELINSLEEEQQKVAIIAKKAPREIRGAGAAQPPKEDPVGIAASKLNETQGKALRVLVGEYLRNFPQDVADKHVQAIRKSGGKNVRFAWAGALKPGVGHYYRIEGPTFVIEFVNTQPDAAGNPANHIHCVWRDMRGDFALPIGKAAP